MSGLIEMLRAGGPIVAILLVLSVVSLTLIGIKIFQLRGVTGGSSVRDTACALWAEGDKTAAIAQLSGARNPADRMLHHAMEGLLAGIKQPALEGDLEWRGNAEVAQLNKHIRALELIAMISPLLGLLGTVLGMIQAFQELALAEGAANASILAAGIWQALLTTAAGLIVAIPAAVAASLLAARVDSAGLTIEAAIGRLFALDGARR